MKYIHTLIYLIFTTSAIAQTIIVVDSISKYPIESAHISYNNNGLITNEDGYFEIPENVENIDSISLSHISFKSKRIAFSGIKKNDTIYLQESLISLDEIILREFRVRDTILKAILKIDENYLDKAYNLFGFFRQSMQENSKGVEMVEVEFISYIENKNSAYSTKITNARRTNNHSKIRFSTIGGVFSVIEKGDFVKRKSYFLDSNNINNYEYLYQGQIIYNDVKVYKIRFSPKNSEDLKFLRKGELYIAANSLAFVEIRYSFDEDKLKVIKEKVNKIKKAKKKPFFVIENLENIIRYRLITENKWALSSIEVENDKIGSFKDLKHKYTLNAKLVINNIKIDKAVPVKTNYNLSKDFSKAIRKFENSGSWNDNYKLSLSNDERRILKDINSKEKSN